MKCPHCGKTLKVPDYALVTADTYHKSCTVVTECCHNAVSVIPVRSFRVEKYNGSRTQDDWGNNIKSDQLSLNL